MSFTIENVKQNRMSLIDEQTICEDETFATYVYHKSTFILILTAFYNLPISLVMFTHSFINAFKFAPVGLNCTLN